MNGTHDQGMTARPRPQYGELATPEEQRAAIAVPVEQSANESVPVPAEPNRPAAAGPAPATATAPPGDRFASWALLGVGLFNILTSAATLIDLPGSIDRFFASDDLDPYGPIAAARALGIGALVLNIGLWLLTLLIVQRRVAAGRSSWWIPLVAGVLGNIVVLVAVGSAMTIDPAIFEHIQRMAGAPR